ncbi:MAG: FAD-dependent tricarballylate dehydrogenase TcuA [Aestuariivita sp.]|nr:FAD-dependent tricarballylate dehydrogenase TcuA [Aestuariivita sp.]MCY4203022.1 FAD-dependent tricarballylate dehydrogenase TcuA [Aestuariivita sp.]
MSIDDLGIPNPEVLVVGGGNAAMTAALTARSAGARVTVLEAAPAVFRGGNSRHTRNFRCQHSKILGVMDGVYEEDEFLNDLLEVTNGRTDKELALVTIRSSAASYHWMEAHGVHFQPALSGTLSLSRTNAFFLGGGKALLNALYARAEDMDIEIYYNAHVDHIEITDNKVQGVEVTMGAEIKRFAPKAVVVASGGFQADLEWLSRAWGQSAKNFLIRGTPYNRGAVLENLLEQGIVAVGDPAQCHAVAIDGRSPKFDGGIVTRIDCVPFSVVVNCNGERFYDEGEDIWPKRYAIWGRLLAEQPNQKAFAIIDSKSKDLFMPSVFPTIETDSIDELAAKLNLPADKLNTTLERFNSACQKGDFTPQELDGLKTTGIIPPKSNWARKINEPPFYGYPLGVGVTFTYLGLKVDAKARTEGKNGMMENLWAAGEIMAGSILRQGYLAGIGMTIGSVFGKIAGREAANYVR